jgi:hypothetical protein
MVKGDRKGRPYNPAPTITPTYNRYKKEKNRVEARFFSFLCLALLIVLFPLLGLGGFPAANGHT